jgi:hypothetical protein
LECRLRDTVRIGAVQTARQSCRAAVSSQARARDRQTEPQRRWSASSVSCARARVRSVPFHSVRTAHFPQRNAPFANVALPPLHSMPIVFGEFMMVIVIACVCVCRATERATEHEQHPTNRPTGTHDTEGQRAPPRSASNRQAVGAEQSREEQSGGVLSAWRAFAVREDCDEVVIGGRNGRLIGFRSGIMGEAVDRPHAVPRQHPRHHSDPQEAAPPIASAIVMADDGRQYESERYVQSPHPTRLPAHN